MIEEKYDSKEDTLKHIRRVQNLLFKCIRELYYQAIHHDVSKLKEPEKPMFDELTPKLKKSSYGSEEYEKFLEMLGPALQHHYSMNRHHPEHYSGGIKDMSLFDIVEMLCDWKAASERQADRNFIRSMEISKERFAISDQLYSVLVRTAEIMGWR